MVSSSDTQRVKFPALNCLQTNKNTDKLRGRCSVTSGSGKKGPGSRRDLVWCKTRSSSMETGTGCYQKSTGLSAVSNLSYNSLPATSLISNKTEGLQHESKAMHSHDTHVLSEDFPILCVFCNERLIIFSSYIVLFISRSQSTFQEYHLNIIPFYRWRNHLPNIIQ